MRPTALLRAVPSSIGAQSRGLKPPPLALLPPIPLYRRLFRAHRKHLNQEMRVLGDEYIKAEFRSHRDTENPVHIVGFLTEWQLYAQQIEGGSWRGEKIEKGKVDKMSDEQIAQMYELMQAIRERELADNDPEYKPHTPPPAPGTE
ncbi:hypothetical protein LTR53_009424 [Teratosphaeriaceae sp. CCFEE 6253]|nr:hypothetical protein LTR53_009424 [Teratosphaeriaceae sp. CCFEE 6253]